ncbi:hypothetical protein J6590_099163, partial [Homalodisca vitripennis]
MTYVLVGIQIYITDYQLIGVVDHTNDDRTHPASPTTIRVIRLKLCGRKWGSYSNLPEPAGILTISGHLSTKVLKRSESSIVYCLRIQSPHQAALRDELERL